MPIGTTDQRIVRTKTRYACLNPAHPDRESRCRGLCMTCYLEARRLVLFRKTSWAALERRGKAISPKTGAAVSKPDITGGHGEVAKWLLA